MPEKYTHPIDNIQLIIDLYNEIADNIESLIYNLYRDLTYSEYSTLSEFYDTLDALITKRETEV